MKENVHGKTLKKVCPTCGKPVNAGKRAGSLTAYLFGGFDCTCASALSCSRDSRESAGTDRDDGNDFCPKCGLQIVSNPKDGSLTGFLFQSTRCKCSPDKAFADGQMSAKFWQLKRTGNQTLFAGSAADAQPDSRSSIGLARDAIIGGTYRIIEQIGSGGMGEVYLARHETLGKQCALKVIPPQQVNEMGWLRFQQEARAVAKLEHLNLVRVTDLGIHEGCLPFYAMDFVEGKNLSELLEKNGPMPLNMVLGIFMQVCDGVDCAHRGGIIHRDLKPANIMVSVAKSGARQAKVLDFGLAKLTPEITNARRVFAQCGSISNGIVVRGGLKVRVFRFPEIPRGTLYWGLEDRYSAVAKGTVIVPAIYPVNLTLGRPVGEYVSRFPEVLAKIGHEDIASLVVKMPQIASKYVVSSYDLPVQLIKTISTWKALTRIEIFDCSISKESLLALNHLSSNMEWLLLKNCTPDGDTLAQVKWLKRLKYLQVDDVENIDAVLAAVAGSTSLRRLYLGASNPSVVALEGLASSPNLEVLGLPDAPMDGKKLAAVCNISTLRELDLRRCNLRLDSLLQLVRLKRLKTLLANNRVLSPEDMVRLHLALPNCKIVYQSRNLQYADF